MNGNAARFSLPCCIRELCSPLASFWISSFGIDIPVERFPSERWYGYCVCGLVFHCHWCISAIISATENNRTSIRSERIWFHDKFLRNNGTWIWGCGKSQFYYGKLMDTIYVLFLLSPQHTHGWNSSVRCRLHWTVLCFHSNLAESILLSLRFLVLSVLYIGCELWSNFDCDDILPDLQWGITSINRSHLSMNEFIERQFCCFFFLRNRTTVGGGDRLSYLVDQLCTYCFTVSSIFSQNYRLRNSFRLSYIWGTQVKHSRLFRDNEKTIFQFSSYLQVWWF